MQLIWIHQCSRKQYFLLLGARGGLPWAVITRNVFSDQIQDNTFQLTKTQGLEKEQSDRLKLNLKISSTSLAFYENLHLLIKTY